MKTFITRTGRYDYTQEELEEQLANSRMYAQADNALGWLVRKIYMTTNIKTQPGAIRRAAKIIRGTDAEIDVRY